MKKSLLITMICSVILLLSVPVSALLIDYTFNQTTGTYTEITGGVSLGTETTDDQRFFDPAVPAGTTSSPYVGPGFPIGFNFAFNDETFDVIAINANGWMSFGQSALGAAAVNITSSSSYAPLGSTSVIDPPQLYNRIAGFARDLQAQVGATLRLETIGTAPNRVCILQWHNYKRYGTTGTGDVINFQIQLHETTNKVAIAYGPFTHGTTTSTTYPQVGMRGPVVTDFVNRTTTDSWTTTTAGTVVTATCAFTPTCIPPDGLIFEYVAPIAATNDLQCLSVAGSTTPSVGAASNYTVRVRNRGTGAQSTYSVKLMLGTTEIGTVPGTAINPMEVLEFTIPWTPATQGPASLTGKVVLTGDEVPINDESSPLLVNVYPEGTLIVIIGNGTSAQRYPLGTTYGYERSGSLFTNAEIGDPGLITSVMWDCAVQYGNVVPYRILMKNTNVTAFIQEPWATTITDAQVCAEGTVTIDQTGWVSFILDTPFMYTGDNLMVLVETNYGGTGTTSSQTFRYTASATASHHYMYAENTPPTTNGYLSTSRPNIGIAFTTAGMGSLSGLVTAGGNPLEGALIEIETTPLNQMTNTAGTYNFPYVQPGTYNVTCSKIGFMTQTQQAVITADQATTLNFVMLPSPNVDVTGFVVGSDAPTVGLADCTVNLTGVVDYTGATDATGHFTIPGVLAGNTYNYVISKASYQSGTGSITVGATNYDMGTIVLTEIVTPPVQVTATPNTDHTEVLINWRAPGAAGPGFFFDFELDDGGWVPSSNWTDPLGDWEWTNTYDVTLYDPTGSTSTQQPPSAAYSGTGLWGTVIYGPYTNVPTSGQRSFLRQTFDLTGLEDPVLNLWHHMDGFNTWDYGQILVNGTVVWGTSATAVFMPWQVLNVDLSAYENQTSVEVSFEWSATTVVNYAGWYIDDVYIGPASTIPTGRSVASNHPQITPYENDRDRALLGYKVWRLLDGQEGNEASWTLLTTTTVTDTFYVNTNWQAVPDGLYKWAVKSVYTNDVLSNPAFSNTVLKHAVVNVTGTVVGSDAPTVGLAGAEISLTGMADYSGTTNAQGQFTIPGVYNLEMYNYTITKLGYTTATGTINVGATDFDMGTITLNEIALPAAAVVAEEAPPNVNITWMAPGTGGGEWIQWDDGTNFNSIGLTSGGTFDVASRWTVTDLTDYVGQSLFAIQFWPGDVATYSLRVWTGGSASGPAQMVVDQPYTAYTVDVMNTVLLDSPVPIQAGQELWFGYNVTHTAGMYPAGTDDGPAHDGLGNMIYNSGAWTTLYTLSTSLNYDWNLAGYVGYSAPTATPIRMAPLAALPFDEVRFNDGMFSASGAKSAAQSSMNLETPFLTRSLEGYKVWRLLEGQESNEAAWTLLTPNNITATAYQDMGWAQVPDGFYKWAVKAAYSNNVMAVPAFSNVVQKLTQIGTIAGIVRKTDNTPIAGATISVGTTTATSNTMGAYSLQVPAGTHTVTCSAAGYNTATQTGVVVVTGQTTNVNFILTVANLVTDGFETYTNFALDFPPWVCVDVDLSTTYTITGVTFPGGGSAMAYIIFNPSATTPPLTTASYLAHGGDKYAACFASTTPANNDWLISQQFNNIGDEASVGFWAKSVTAAYGLERFKVGLSDGGTAPANFTIISGAAYIEAPIDWTWYEFDIPASYIGQSLRAGIQCVSNDAFIFMLDDFVMDLGTTGIVDPVTPVVATALNGNFPNPFNPETTISYSVKGTNPTVVEIYNAKGQRVKTLVNETKAEGHYQAKWDGKDENNQPVTSGVYFYRMKSGKFTSFKKMILLK